MTKKPPFAVGVLLENSEIKNNLDKMSDIIRNRAFQNRAAIEAITEKDEEHYNPDEFFHTDSVMNALQDAVNHDIEFFTNVDPKQNLGNSIQDMIEDNFPGVAPYINDDPRVLTVLGSLYASALTHVVQAVRPAIEDVLATGNEIDKIETFSIGYDKSYYVITGEEPEPPIVEEPDPIEGEHIPAESVVNKIPRLNWDGIKDYSQGTLEMEVIDDAAPPKQAGFKRYYADSIDDNPNLPLTDLQFFKQQLDETK